MPENEDMKITSVQIHVGTKKRLIKNRKYTENYRKETLEDVINRALNALEKVKNEKQR